MDISPLEIFSFSWFICCWLGYSLFARKQAKKRNSLSSVLYRYRKEWVLKLSKSGMSEVDSDLLGSLERQVSFMASTSLLKLASLVTVLSAASEDFMNMSSLQFVDEVSLEIVQMKLLMMIYWVIFLPISVLVSKQFSIFVICVKLLIPNDLRDLFLVFIF
jgi:uncharacterized membrane protein